MPKAPTAAHTERLCPHDIYYIYKLETVKKLYFIRNAPIFSAIKIRWYGKLQLVNTL